MNLRSLFSFGLLTAAVCWVTSAEAQPGPRGGGGAPADTAKLQAEIQKLKAALADAEAKLEKARKAPSESDKLVEALKKLLEGEKQAIEPGLSKGGWDKGWGNWGGKGNFEKGGFERGWTPNGLKIPEPTENDKIVKALKELLDKKAAPAKTEATKATNIEQRLDALQKSLDEIRRELRKK